MTIEPGEVIAVLAAATLLALEGLISQVRVMNQNTGWEQDLRASQYMGAVQILISSQTSRANQVVQCEVIMGETVNVQTVVQYWEAASRYDNE